MVVVVKHFLLDGFSHEGFFSLESTVRRYENDELKPYVEPEADMNDPKRIEVLVSLGFNRFDVENSLDTQKYDDVFATYLLLGRKNTDVSDLVSVD